MDRREFLKAGTMAAAFATLASKLPAQVANLAADAGEQKTDAAKKPEVVAVRKGGPVDMFRKGVEALGGMAAFVKPGQSVCVKPNIGWDRAPELGADTNPDLVGEIVRQCLAAGASKVEVFDHTCHEWGACYRNSGIKDAVEKAGGTMLPGNDESWYVERECPGAASMKTAKIHKCLLDSDVVINVPILKNHGGAKMTACMKNYMGVVWDRQFMHKNNMPQCIADSFLYRRPDLNVLDAYRMMTTRGPQGGSPDNVEMCGYLLLSANPVVLDTIGAKLMRYDPSDVPYIALAEKLGLGRADDKELDAGGLITRIDA